VISAALTGIAKNNEKANRSLFIFLLNCLAAYLSINYLQ